MCEMQESSQKIYGWWSNRQSPIEMDFALWSVIESVIEKLQCTQLTMISMFLFILLPKFPILLVFGVGACVCFSLSYYLSVANRGANTHFMGKWIPFGKRQHLVPLTVCLSFACPKKIMQFKCGCAAFSHQFKLHIYVDDFGEMCADVRDAFYKKVSMSIWLHTQRNRQRMLQGFANGTATDCKAWNANFMQPMATWTDQNICIYIDIKRKAQ